MASKINYKKGIWRDGQKCVAYSDADLNKLEAGVKAACDAADAGGGVTVDSTLSLTSTNPVQNKVINSALTTKQDKIDSNTDLTGGDITANGTITVGSCGLLFSNAGAACIFANSDMLTVSGANEGCGSLNLVGNHIYMDSDDIIVNGNMTCQANGFQLGDTSLSETQLI